MPTTLLQRGANNVVVSAPAGNYRLQSWETVARRIAAASLGCEKQVAQIGQTVVVGSLLQDALTRVPLCSG